MAGPDNSYPYPGSTAKPYQYAQEVYGNWASQATTAVTTSGDSWFTGVGMAGTTSDTAKIVWQSWAEPVTTSLPFDGALASKFNPDTFQDFEVRTVWTAIVEKALTPEQELVQKKAAEVRKSQYAELAEAKANAQLRAEALLIAALTVEQKKEYGKDKTFTVWAAGKRYRIKEGRSHNIEELNSDGLKIATLCAHPREFVPNFDTMLAQKLMLETVPDEFLRLANRSEVRVQ